MDGGLAARGAHGTDGPVGLAWRDETRFLVPFE